MAIEYALFTIPCCGVRRGLAHYFELSVLAQNEHVSTHRAPESARHHIYIMYYIIFNMYNVVSNMYHVMSNMYRVIFNIYYVVPSMYCVISNMYYVLCSV